MSLLESVCVEAILNADGLGELCHMVLMFTSVTAQIIGDV